jgi:hypothetical protein
MIFCGLLLTGPSVSAQEEPQQTIILKDGTVLKGNLLSVSGDTYVIHTGNLGDVKVSAGDIQSISAGNVQPAMGTGVGMPMVGGTGMAGMSAGAINPAQVNAMASSMMADPQINSIVQEMASDPEMMALMQDPTFVQALMSMNTAQLQNDPRFQQLLANPKMQNLINTVGPKMIPAQQ